LAPDVSRPDVTAVVALSRLVGESTYLPTGEGWLYLATVMGLRAQEVASWF
jgi:putative transposase